MTYAIRVRQRDLPTFLTSNTDMAEAEQDLGERSDGDNSKADKLFTLKKWNAVAMWSWDVECDTCAICRVQVMGKSFIRLENRNDRRSMYPAYGKVNLFRQIGSTAVINYLRLCP
ncbi:hypothetical protein KM043_004282 [Ampulex compressa]|nr:hypothetical protein KM043_004282 [Ampulex compressa]